VEEGSRGVELGAWEAWGGEGGCVGVVSVGSGRGSMGCRLKGRCFWGGSWEESEDWSD